MTDRLTLRDWQIINKALALYEADPEPCDGAGNPLGRVALYAHSAAIGSTRDKVHQRLKGRYGD